jgi:hypothetical protein
MIPAKKKSSIWTRPRRAGDSRQKWLSKNVQRIFPVDRHTPSPLGSTKKAPAPQF